MIISPIQTLVQLATENFVLSFSRNLPKPTLSYLGSRSLKAKNLKLKKKQPRDQVSRDPLPAFPVQKWVALSFSVVTFALYALTLAPSVGGGDSGELTAVASSLGVAHPPGYPLFTMLGKLFSWFPHGSVAWRINLASAFCDAIAGFFLCLAIQVGTRNTAAGLLGAALFCFSPLVWDSAVVAEVFALNNAFVSILLYLAARYNETPRPKILMIATFVFGLGLSNHHTLILVGAPLGIWFLMRDPRRNLKPRFVAKLIGICSLGLLPYLYLPLAAQNPSLASWGDTASWNGFWIHFFRSEYGTAALSNELTGDGNFFLYFWEYLKLVPSQMLFGLWLLGVAGVVHLFRNPSRNSWGLIVFGAGLVYILVFFSLVNLSLDSALTLMVPWRFYQLVNLTLAVMVAVGFAYWVSRVKVRYADLLLALLLSLAQVALNYKSADQSSNTVYRDYARAVLSPLPKDAVLLIQGDHNFGSLSYAQVSEQERTDVKVIHFAFLSRAWGRSWLHQHFPEIKLPNFGAYVPGGYSVKDLVSLNSDRFEFFIVGGVKDWDKSYLETYKLWQWGLAQKFLPIEQTPDIATWLDRNEREFGKYSTENPRKFADGSWEHEVYKSYLGSRHNFAVQALNYAMRNHTGQTTTLLEIAIRNFEAILEDHAKEFPVIYKNLGLSYMHWGSVDQSKLSRGLEYWRKFLESHPKEDQDVLMIRSMLESTSH